MILHHVDIRSSISGIMASDEQQHPLRILVAEDNVFNLKVTLSILGKIGYKADAAANGIEVLAALRRQKYDVILMDGHMPEMDGMQATTAIRRELPPEDQPRIFAMTADTDIEYRDQCLSAGMDDYIIKPVRPEELKRLLEPSLAGKQPKIETARRTEVSQACNPSETCELTELRKYRRVIERLFFHDVANTAIGIRGLSEMLAEAETGKAPEIVSLIRTAAGKLVDQIQSQRILSAAETGSLTVSVQQIDSVNLCKDISANWQEELKVRGIGLEINCDFTQVIFSSDKTILSNVLNSMIKNAFEASSQGMVIRIGCRQEDRTVVFSIWNKTFMEKDVQSHIFQKFFSTKGQGFGQGTYGIKLLAEQYLNGRVYFSSDMDAGTVFCISLPLELPKKEK